MKDTAAVIYVRVSTKGQDKYSPDAQLKFCRTYAKSHGLDVVEEFIEKRSGWKPGTRIEFPRMAKFIEQNKIPNVIYAFGDRTGRNTEDYVL